MWRNWPAKQSNSVKIARLLRCSKSFKVIEVGINRKPVGMRLVRTDILSFTGVIAAYCSNFGHFAFWAPFGEIMNNVRWSSWVHLKARSGLPISVNWTFFARCYDWSTTSEYRSKIGDFSLTRSLWPTISGRRGRPLPIIFAWIVRPMNALQHIADSFQTKKLCSRLSSCELWF